jgi:MoaA/NifB/PqqE/SkfB family radical SAM enzyme
MDVLRFISNVGLVSKIFMRKPKFFARAIGGFFRATLLKEQRMRFMDIAVNYDCNLSCTHCSALPMQRTNENPLSVDEYKSIAEGLRREGVVLFHFTGGEPLLRKDLEEIIRAFGPEQSCISIQTNGFPATPKRLQSLRDAGVDILCVSLDSGIEMEHDAFRGRDGSYKKVLEVQSLAKDMGFITMVSTCVSHENIHSDGLHKVISLTKEMGVSCQFNLAVPTGHWQDNTSIILTEEDKVEVRRLLKQNRHCRLDLYHNWTKVGCGAIKEKLYLNPYGDVLPCPFIQIAFGNLKRESVHEVRKNALNIEQFRKYWPECLAAEDHDFMEQVAHFSEGSATPLTHFNLEQWRAASGRSSE